MDREAEILFHELADLSPAQRESYFRERQVPVEVRAEVEELLLFDARGDDCLTGCVAASAEQLLGASAKAEEDRRCGRYRLVCLLGRGGMGSVHLAERDDGEVKQRVAIKLLRYGGEEPAFLDRFLRERQILAALSHPGIARLLDAGHTEDGRPYLAMDYIDGTPIDVYAEKLELRGKLGLFLRVCEAVAYAHRNLILHRDIKPSNILVDPSGEPKLLDFGIAKILDASINQTGTQERMLTPEYASPEQVRGATQSVTSDIYSLGAVLYKLLTGRSPHALASGNREAIEFAICSTEPAAPSTMNPTVPKDLDFIVRKALRKGPEERYGSADALAGDIQAFLESRPVRARSGNAWYRTRKFMRRYWGPIAAALLVIASLSAGLYVANRERVLAQRRFQQVRQLANKVLALDSLISQLPGSIKAREEIVAMAQQYLEGLRPEAKADQDLAVELAEAYYKLAHAQGVPSFPNLGRFAAADDSLQKADALLEAVLKRSPRNRRALLLSAEVAHDRMVLAGSAGRDKEELAQARKCAARLDAYLSLGKVAATESATAARLYGNIALHHKNLHLYEDSIRYAHRAIETAPSSNHGRIAGNALSIIADSLRFSGNLEGALDAIEEAHTIIENAESRGEIDRRTDLFNVLWREGVILGQDGDISLERPEEAATVLGKASNLMEEWAQRDPNDAGSRIRLAQASAERGLIVRHIDPRSALEIFDHALLRLSEIKDPNPVSRRGRILLLACSSYPLRSLHREAEARQRIDEALELLGEAKQYPVERIDPDGEAAIALRASADHLAETGQPQRAAQVYRELLDKTMASKRDLLKDIGYATKLSRTYQAMAALDRRNANPEEAAMLDARRLELWRHWNSHLPNNPFVQRQLAAAEFR